MTQQAGLECIGTALLQGLGPAVVEVVRVKAVEQRLGRVGCRRLEKRRADLADIHQFGQVIQVAVGCFGHRRLDALLLFFGVSPPACVGQCLFIGFAQSLEAGSIVIRPAAFQQPRIGALDGALVGVFRQLQYGPTLHVVFPQRQNPLSSCSS